MQDWTKFEQFIKWNANKLSRNESDFDDFVQIGKIAAWETVHDKPYVTDAYIRSRINSRQINHMLYLYETEKNAHYQNELPDDIFDYV